MKIGMMILGLMIVVAQSASAQLTPDVDFSNPSGLISVKTDPVLKDPRSMIFVKTDPVLKDPRETIAIKTDPVLKALGAGVDASSINLDLVLGLVTALEARGAKVALRTESQQGVQVLEVKVDGKVLPTYLLSCESCPKK